LQDCGAKLLGDIGAHRELNNAIVFVLSLSTVKKKVLLVCRVCAQAMIPSK
jgi:hypothetical protein